MKIICQKDRLIEGINLVQKAVSSKSSIQLLEGILIEADEIITLTGNDLELCIQCKIIGDIRETGKIVVNSKLFGEIIKKLSEDDVLIEVLENNNIKIECGHSKFDLRGMSANGYPAVPDVQSEKGLIIKQNILREMIRQTIFAIGTDDNKPVLMGSLLELKDGNLSIVAIDGYRMALRKEKSDIEQEGFSMIVPGKTLSEILKVLKPIDETVEIRAAGNQIMFKVDGSVVISRLIEGKFLNYSNLLPANSVSKLVVDTKAFLQSAERASIMAVEDKKYPIKLQINDDRIIITSNTETGQSREEVETEIEGNDINIALNPKYLIDSLKVIEDEKVHVFFASEVGPCMIKPMSGDAYAYMIAAVKV